MLVDRRVLEKGEAVLVVRLLGHHDVGTGSIAAYQVIALNGGAGRRTADHAASVEDVPELGEGLRVHV